MNVRSRPWRCLTLPLLLLGAALLCGYVVPAEQVLERWGRAAAVRTPEGDWEVPIRWNGRPGRLYGGGPGRTALELDGDAVVLHAADPATRSLAGFWLLVDLWTGGGGGPEELALLVAEAGIDLGRVGYARTPKADDGVAHVLGARGEGESELPQVWFGRVPFWLCRVALADARVVEAGRPQADGWPAAVQLGEGVTVEFLGPATPSRVPPPPPRSLEPLPPADPEGFFPDWRKAFEPFTP